MDVSMTTLLIVAAAVMLLVMYWKDSHSTPVRQPASPARVPENSDEFLRLEYARLNRAYRCFAFLGLVTLPFGLAALLQAFGLMDFNFVVGTDARGVGQRLSQLALVVSLVLGGPIVLGMLGATVYGIRQTVRFRHTALVVLSLVSIVCGSGLMILLAILGNGGGPIVEYAIDIAFGSYITANVFVPAWWFAMGRRRYRSKANGRIVSEKEVK